MNIMNSQRITSPTRKRGYCVLHRHSVLFPRLRVGLVLFTIALTSPLIAVDDPPPAGPIVANPPAIEFRQHRQIQSLQLLGSTADGYSLDLRTPAQLTIADPKIAVIDDYQSVAERSADWSVLGDDVVVTFFHDHADDPRQLVNRLHPYDVVVAMRERTAFPGDVLRALPNLRLLVATGMHHSTIDFATATELERFSTAAVSTPCCRPAADVAMCCT